MRMSINDRMSKERLLLAYGCSIRLLYLIAKHSYHVECLAFIIRERMLSGISFLNLDCG